MAKVKKALIVGGGIGGLSAAIALRKNGIEVDLVEINQQWTVYHVGIVVQGNAVRAMAALGIAEKCIKAGFQYSGLLFRDLDDNVIADIPGIKLAGPDYPSDLGLTRPALHEVLTKSAIGAGAKVRLGVTFTELRQSEDKVTVAFTDGTTRDYDVVIGADGLRSKVREVLFGNAVRPKPTGQGVWRYNVPRPKEMDRAVIHVGLATGKCGFIPLTEDTGYVLLVQAEPINERLPDDKLAELFRARLARCTGSMARLRDQIVDSSMVVYRPLDALFLPAPWYRGRVVLMGDAVHATTPHVGQGAAQAMEDAVVLGDVLSRDAPIESQLQEFMRRRYERCKVVYESSLQIGEWEQRPTPDADSPALMARLIASLGEPI